MPPSKKSGSLIRESALRGYVLEELLAWLLRGSGYRLLSAATDTKVLKDLENGLCIRGRGSYHQADVLGELERPVDSTYPLRLFLEAKAGSKPVGLGIVRNAVGVINDVNEEYRTDLDNPDDYRQRYDYRYVLFSTSGFSKEARLYAVTHRISLQDLSDPRFKWLADHARRIATALLRLAVKSKVASFPVAQMRTALRRALGTAPESKWGPYATDEGFAAAQHRASKLAPDEAPTLNPDQLAQVVASALDLVEEPGELVLLATNSPFLLVGQTDAPTDAPRLDRSERQLTAELAFKGRSPRRERGH